MDSWMIFVQALGIAAMIISFLSLQCRTNKNYLIMQCVAMALFTAHFTLLGSIAGALMNLIGAARSVVFYYKKNQNKAWSLILFEIITVLSILFCIIYLKENVWLTLLVLCANGTNTWAIWTGNGKFIRIVVLTVQAPLWIIYNAFAFSIAGIITEVFNIFSSAIALYRYRKIGFQ